MARPRVFISSTFYDLKYLRASLELFVRSLGFDPILSEKGDIAYMPDGSLDKSCFREAAEADIYVLIIGGRYGSEVSETKAASDLKSGPLTDLEKFYRDYESITKGEFQSAADKDVPIFILIERGVHAEYQTFKRNREATNINYAHADSVNIFHFIDAIYQMKQNNPVQSFDKPTDIEEWLRSQWAGIFREMLKNRSTEREIASLAAQVAQLADVNITLKRYIEQVMKQVAPDDASALIATEDTRLADALETRIGMSDAAGYVLTMLGKSRSETAQALIQADSWEAFLTAITHNLGPDQRQAAFDNPGLLSTMKAAANRARIENNLNPFEE